MERRSERQRIRLANNSEEQACLDRKEDERESRNKMGEIPSQSNVDSNDSTRDGDKLSEIKSLRRAVEALKIAGWKIIKTHVQSAVERLKGLPISDNKNDQRVKNAGVKRKYNKNRPRPRKKLCAEAARKKDKLRAREARARLTEEELNFVRQREAKRAKEYRSKMPEDKLNIIRQREAQRARERRSKMTEDQLNIIRLREAKRSRERSAKRTEDQINFIRQREAKRMRDKYSGGYRQQRSSSNIKYSCLEIFPIPIINHAPSTTKRTQSGIFFCVICNDEFNNATGLKHHYTRHHTESEILEGKEKQAGETRVKDGQKGTDYLVRVYNCELCSEKCYSIPAYRQHIIQKHRADKDFVEKMCFVCSFCDEAFSVEIHLSNHNREFHDIFTQCQLCHENIKTQELFTKHIDEIHPDCGKTDDVVISCEKGFFCKVCGLTNKFRSNVLSHSKTHALDKSLKCDICNLEFESRRTLIGHQRKVHEKRSFCCELCGHQSVSEGALRSHKRKHKPTGNKNERVECKKCDKTFSSKSNYKYHYLTAHEKQRPFQCTICQKTFTNQPGLYQHKITICEKEKSVPKTCPICGKILDNYLLLYYHKHNFHKFGNTEENVCHVCNKTLKNPLTLFYHNRTRHRTEEEQKTGSCMKCAVCEKSCSTKSGLLEHWRMHREERPYSCNLCDDLTFRYPYQFYAHRKKDHQSETETAKIITDPEVVKTFKKDFNEAHATQFVKKSKTQTNLECPEEITNNSAVNVPDRRVSNVSVNSVSENPNVDKSYIAYIDFSRANNPVGLGGVQENPPIQDFDVDNSLRKDNNEDSEISNSHKVNDKMVDSESEFCDAFLNSPMSVYCSDGESAIESKPFAIGSNNLHLDLLKMRLVVEIERLKECFLCNEVFLLPDLHEGHLKSKGHRAAVRENNREAKLLKKEKRRDAKMKQKTLKSKSHRAAIREIKKEAILLEKDKWRDGKRKHKKLKSKEDDDIEEFYSCHFCNKKFESLNKYKKHITKHKKSTTKATNCLMCSERFLNVRKLVDHYISEHNGEKVVKCEICDMGFLEYQPRNLREHMRSQHSKEKKRPSKWSHKSYSCENCGEKFAECKLYKSHLLSHNNDEYKCVHCAQEFNGLIELEGHYNENHNGEMPFRCCECPQSFLTQIGLQKHEKEVHPKKDLTKKLVFICDECGKSFSRPCELTYHKTTHKPVEERQKLFCEFCGKSFFQAHSLAIHRREHTGEKPYPCNLCESGVGFISPALLKNHIDTVHNKNSHVCDICGKSFDRRRNLQNHHRSKHPSEVTTKKTYSQCEYCPKGFSKPELLKKHMEVHDSSRPFGCDHCSWRFKYSSNLHLHIKGVHEKMGTVYPKKRKNCS